MNVWMNEWLDECINELMNEWTNIHTNDSSGLNTTDRNFGGKNGSVRELSLKGGTECCKLGHCKFPSLVFSSWLASVVSLLRPNKSPSELGTTAVLNSLVTEVGVELGTTAVFDSLVIEVGVELDTTAVFDSLVTEVGVELGTTAVFDSLVTEVGVELGTTAVFDSLVTEVGVELETTAVFDSLAKLKITILSSLQFLIVSMAPVPFVTPPLDVSSTAWTDTPAVSQCVLQLLRNLFIAGNSPSIHGSTATSSLKRENTNIFNYTLSDLPTLTGELIQECS